MKKNIKIVSFLIIIFAACCGCNNIYYGNHDKQFCDTAFLCQLSLSDNNIVDSNGFFANKNIGTFINHYDLRSKINDINKNGSNKFNIINYHPVDSFGTVTKIKLSIPTHINYNKKKSGQHSDNMLNKAFVFETLSDTLKETLSDTLKSKMPSLTNKERHYISYIFKASKQYQVDVALIKAIIMAESSYNHKAVSCKGAVGLMQLMPKTAKYLGVKNSFDPKNNIDGGVKYIKLLLDRFDGNVTLALAAYNAGSTNVRRYKGVPPFKATKIYIKKVMKYQKYYKKQMQNIMA